MVSSANEPIQVAHKNEQTWVGIEFRFLIFFLFHKQTKHTPSNLIYVCVCVFYGEENPISNSNNRALLFLCFLLLDSIMNDYYYRFLFYSNWQKVKLHRLFDSSYDGAFHSLHRASFSLQQNFYNENLFCSLFLFRSQMVECEFLLVLWICTLA